MARKMSNAAGLPVVVDTQYAALTTLFFIDNVNDQILSQWYDAANQTYSPDRSITPLVLVPTLSISDPDGVLPSLVTSFTSVTWTEYSQVAGGAVTTKSIPSQTASGEYSVAANGTLTVNKNVPESVSVRLHCQVQYTDVRTGEVLYFDDEVQLITTKTEDPATILCLKSARTYTYRPLMNAVSNGEVVVNNVAFSAVLMCGDNVVNDAKYFWYWADSNHTSGVLFGDNTTPCAAFVSQAKDNTTKVSTLTLNPDRTDGLTIILKAARSGSASTPDADIPSETFILSVFYDEVTSDVYSENGQSLRSEMPDMTFGALLKAHGRDIDPVIEAEYIRKNWKYKKTDVSSYTDAGWGDKTTIDRSALVTSISAAKNTIVQADVYLLGAEDFLTYNGALITDDSGSSDASSNGGYVVGRT